MKLEDLKLVNMYANEKAAFEHAADRIKIGTQVVISFTGATNKDGGSVNFRLDEDDLEMLRSIFSSKAREASNELCVLGVDITNG